MSPPFVQPGARFRQLRKLTEVSRALTYAMTLAEVLALAVRHATELLGVEKAVLLLSDEQGLLRVQASHGLEAERCEQFNEPLAETLITRLRRLLGDVEEREFLGVPLVVGGEVTGILAVALTGVPDDLEDEEWLLSALADQAAVALERTREQERAGFEQQLIGIVSHDLRNPMSAIALATTLLESDREIDAVVRKNALTRMKRSLARANHMIDDLLDFTQARLGGGIHVQRRPADAHAVIAQVVDELALGRPERQIEVSRQGDGGGEWDPDRLGQAISNLLSNALQHGAEGVPVRIDVRGDEAEVTITIHNRGPAIPEARLPVVFEPMQRASANSKSGRSVGLGLFIVKQIVEAHHGRVSVASSDAEGTTFTVVLPRREPRAGAAE